MKRTSVCVLAFLLCVCMLWPIPHTLAAFISNVSVNNFDEYLIAGNPHKINFSTDENYFTDVHISAEYSPGGLATWYGLGITHYDKFNSYYFILPIDSQITSVKIKLKADFDPLIGSKSHSEQIIGPYKVLQPGSITDFTASPNKDGSVTLAWTDNSNMESHYQITRDGPDGSKVFTVNNTTDNMGPLSYIDDTTEKYASTIYAYSVLPVIDKYVLPDNIKPGTVMMLVKTKAQLNLKDGIKTNPLLDPSKLIDKTRPDIIKIEPALKFSEIWSKYLLDIDKVAVSSIMLDKKVLNLELGRSESLNAAVIPSNAANQNVIWSSDNKDVATVDSVGKVTGLSPGLTIITVKADSGGFTASCIVSVTEIPRILEIPGSKEPAPEPPTIHLTDIDKHWANPEIMQAVKLGVVSGYNDGTFRPDASVTRAEFTSMLIRGLKPEIVGSPLSFNDKKDISAWAVQAVEQAVKLGFISGYTDGTIRPNANITHAEMISMVIRASNLPMEDAETTVFVDDATIPKWVRGAVSTAEKNGIIIVSGFTGNNFAPQVLTTRAEAAAAIVRMLNAKK